MIGALGAGVIACAAYVPWTYKGLPATMSLVPQACIGSQILSTFDMRLLPRVTQKRPAGARFESNGDFNRRRRSRVLYHD